MYKHIATVALNIPQKTVEIMCIVIASNENHMTTMHWKDKINC